MLLMLLLLTVYFMHHSSGFDCVILTNMLCPCCVFYQVNFNNSPTLSVAAHLASRRCIARHLTWLRDLLSRYYLKPYLLFLTELLY